MVVDDARSNEFRQRLDAVRKELELLGLSGG
jgi:hypothetical protein